MTTRLYFLLFALLIFAGCNDPVPITFSVECKEPLAEGQHVYLTGNQEILGAWNPSKTKLELQADGKWTKELSFPQGTALEFKFTKGTWMNEAVDANGIVPSNHQHKVTKKETIHFQIEEWKDNKHTTTGKITGNVNYHKDITPKGLQTRNVIVWLPPSYDTSSTKRYPVLYAHDAQNIFDPTTSYLGHDWQIDEVADSLTKAGTVEEFIVVGIENTGDRSAEYAPGEKGELYMDFLCYQLKPYIDSLYNTKSDRANTMTMGSSMGGLISFMLIWERGTIFSKAACLSPAFKFRDIDFTRTVNQYRGPKKDFQVYIDNGTLGLEQQLQPGIDLMLDILPRKGYSREWFLDDGAEHNEMAWANRVWRPIVFLFGK